MVKALASKTGQVNYLQKGEPGDKGARLRMRDWSAGQSHLCGSAGEEWYDVVLHKNLLYLCNKSHTSSSANNPQTSVANNLGYWEKAQDWTFVATKLLLAERIKAEDIDADNLVAKNVDIEGSITASSLYLGVSNNSNSALENGSVRIGHDIGKLPALEPGTSRSIKWIIPRYTRVIIPARLTTENSNVRIAPDGSVLFSVLSYDIADVNGSSYDLFGYRDINSDTTYWCLYGKYITE